MFRDRIVQWGRVLSPFTYITGAARKLACKNHSVLCDLEDGTDQYRTKLNLDVSRAYIRLAQPPL